VFLMIGGGSGFAALRTCVAERGLDAMFRFLPYQDRADLKYSLAVPDLHWLSLRPELEGTIVPGKFYGIAAAGRPIAAITAADGEVARLVRQHGAGIVVPPGDSAGLAGHLRRLAGAPQELAEMGRSARRMLDREFTRRHAFARWRDLFASLDEELRF
jgi:glycosyltransferase involved in cell wall biosynthesis